MKVPDGYVVIFHDNHGKDVDYEMKDLVLCKNCKHRPEKVEESDEYDMDTDLEFPDEVCPCQCDDYYYSWMPDDDWFCKNGERREE